MKFLILLLSIQIQAFANNTPFEQVLKSMIDSHHDSKLAKKELDAAKWNFRKTQGKFLPELSLNANFNNEDNYTNDILKDDFSEFYGATSTWNIFNLGSDWSNYRSAKENRKYQEQANTVALLAIEKEITLELFNYFLIKDQYQNYTETVKLKQELNRIAKRKFSQGRMSETDSYKVEIDLLNAESELAQKERQLAESKAQLDKWKGNYQSLNSWPLINIAKDLIVKWKSTPLQPFVQNAMAMQIESLAWRKRSTSLANRLKVDLNLSHGHYKSLQIDDDYWSAGVMVTVPIFEGWNRASEHANAVNDYYAGYTELQEVQSARPAKEKALLENLENAWNNFQKMKRSYELANKIFNQSRRQFNGGNLSVNDLFLDQDRVLNTQNNYYQAIYDLHAQLLSTCHYQGQSLLTACQ